QEPDGSTSTIHAFVMILGFSRAMYVEFVDRCTLETFMDCHIHALHYLVPIHKWPISSIFRLR
ncbi:MAG: transposase, partial [Deltaproteobacteria bacterium]|nr:transposase [Deltaproteobacteria bacterium]